MICESCDREVKVHIGNCYRCDICKHLISIESRKEIYYDSDKNKIIRHKCEKVKNRPKVSSDIVCIWCNSIIRGDTK